MSGAARPGAVRESLRAEAERVRDVPLEPLARRLGYARDPRNRARWRKSGSVLSIDGAKFHDHLQGWGGGGAIDLVMHARCCGFREAVEFLRGWEPPPAPPPPKAPRPLQLPRPDFRQWPAVRDYLSVERGLEPEVLDDLRARGLLYADARRNAVFPCRDRAGRVAGAELAGTRPRFDGSVFKGMAPGSRKARGGFWFWRGSGEPEVALLAESAVDALSAWLLPAPVVPPGALVASTAGIARALPPWLDAWNPPVLPCGYDADEAGDAAARALRLQHPRIMRLRPRGAKDWNELLCRPPRPAGSP